MRLSSAERARWVELERQLRRELPVALVGSSGGPLRRAHAAVAYRLCRIRWAMQQRASAIGTVKLVVFTVAILAAVIANYFLVANTNWTFRPYGSMYPAAGAPVQPGHAATVPPGPVHRHISHDLLQ